jgi:hypothetical protein
MSLSRYLWLVLIVTAILFGGREAAVQIVKFGCVAPNGVWPADGWMSSCASEQVGGIDESVVWFGLEKSVPAAVQAADVLVFGDSRIEFAYSRGNGSEWFLAHHLKSYLLAFGGGAESGLAQQLLKKFKPHPAVLIFNVDPYFTGEFSLHGQSIAANPDRELAAILETRSFMDRHAKYCKFIGWFCGRTTSSYRAYADGRVFSYEPERFWFGKAMAGHFPIGKPPPWNTETFAGYLQNARAVISMAGTDPKCVIFTVVPNSEQDDGLAQFLAQRTGGVAIAPQFDGLTTSDTSHLTVESAAVWTPAFLNQSLPTLQRCIQPK